MLIKNKFLVFDFDFFNMTGLHWAVKRNHIRVVKFLLKYNSFIDRVDIWDRKPLYYAVKNKSESLCYMLLLNDANPWSNKE